MGRAMQMLIPLVHCVHQQFKLLIMNKKARTKDSGNSSFASRAESHLPLSH